jgi:hypothetical protein
VLSAETTVILDHDQRQVAPWTGMHGILLITLSAVAHSSAGFFTRLIHLDAWTMLFWRGCSPD